MAEEMNERSSESQLWAIINHPVSRRGNGKIGSCSELSETIGQETVSRLEGVSDMAGLGISLHRLQVCGLGTGGDALTEF
jgi:hypothetical protein